MSKYWVAASSIAEVAMPGSNNRKWIYYQLRLVNSCASTAAKNTPYTVGGKIILSAARNHHKKIRSQMTSKCGKNKKVAHEEKAKCVTDVPTTF